jgi:aldehyde:ferredoxin oxidoreductase
VVGMCLFLKYDDPRMVEIINAVTGWGIDEAEVSEIAERSLTLARLFNLREGSGAQDDHLPEQVMKPHVSGMLAKVRLDADEVAKQVGGYYQARGWGADGVPLPATVQKLGLADLALA